MATNTQFVDTLGGTSNLLVEVISDIMAGFAVTVSSVIVVLTTWQTRADQRACLNTMDGRLLEDMGLTRAAVDKEAHKPFWKA